MVFDRDGGAGVRVEDSNVDRTQQQQCTMNDNGGDIRINEGVNEYDSQVKDELFRKEFPLVKPLMQSQSIR